jgi:hypothetical protein
MAKRTIIFGLMVFACSILTISSSVMGALVISDPPSGGSPPPSPSSNLTITKRPYNYHLITNGDSITFSWKATTNKATNGYKIYIDGIVRKTGSWSSGVAKEFTFTPSTAGYKNGDLTIKIRFYDIEKSTIDYVYLTITPDNDGDGLGNEIETDYTGTNINDVDNFNGGPKVNVKLHFRAGQSHVYFNGQIDENGYGTITRRLYVFLQRHLCGLSSNIVRIERTDKIKIMQIDNWKNKWYQLWLGSHGSVVKSCIFDQIYNDYDEGVDFFYKKWDVQGTNTVTGGLQYAKTYGYDIICCALEGGWSDKSLVTELVREYGTIIVCGTGNSGTDEIFGKSAHDYTIAVGAAMNILDFADYFGVFDLLGVGLYAKSPNSNYGEGMDFLIDGHGPGITLIMTSWATGKCAGMVLNMLCANQNLNPMTLRNLMRQSALQPCDVDMEEYPYKSSSSVSWPDYGWYETVGYGLVFRDNCYNLAQAQLNYPY